jgi:hypothetical protein
MRHSENNAQTETKESNRENYSLIQFIISSHFLIVGGPKYVLSQRFATSATTTVSSKLTQNAELQNRVI